MRKIIPPDLENEHKLARAIHDFGTFYTLLIQNNAAGLFFMGKILSAGFIDAEDFYNTARAIPTKEPPADFLPIPKRV